MDNPTPRPNRRSIRIPGYAYTGPGAYFVTICTHDRQHLFGRVTDGQVVLSDYGRVVEQRWHRIPRSFSRARLDVFVIMPNHVHAVLWIDPPQPGAPVAAEPQAPGSGPRGVATHSLGAIVGNFKSTSTRRINQMRKAPGRPVWQRNYYEHIVRSEEALHAIRTYIDDNPRRWQWDRYNVDAQGPDARAVDLWRLLRS